MDHHGETFPRFFFLFLHNFKMLMTSRAWSKNPCHAMLHAWDPSRPHTGPTRATRFRFGVAPGAVKPPSGKWSQTTNRKPREHTSGCAVEMSESKKNHHSGDNQSCERPRPGAGNGNSKRPPARPGAGVGSASSKWIMGQQPR